MGDWFETFRILDAPSRFVRANLMLIWLTVIFLFWLSSPVKAISHPWEIWQAFQRMWAIETQANLVYNTYLTLKLNAFGLFWASLISLSIAYFSVIPVLKTLNQMVQWLRYIPIVSVESFNRRRDRSANMCFTPKPTNKLKFIFIF